MRRKRKNTIALHVSLVLIIVFSNLIGFGYFPNKKFFQKKVEFDRPGERSPE